MPKQYALKRTLISKETLDRLFKSFLNNSKEDRNDAKDLFNRAIDILDRSFSAGVGEENIFSFLKTMEVALKAQSNKSATNVDIRNCLKLIKDFLDKPIRDKDNPNTELDNHLNELVNSFKDEIKDGEDE